ncbi:MAG: zinc ribbon domain-containing protein [Syntrophaceae bacterium]|nr:zinc ribbon domain-containing protein [Syntrophaceae bacterium]
MPIYSYVCNDCGEKFDLLIGVTSEKPELKCKKCGSKHVEKVFGVFGIKNSSGTSSSACPTGTCPIQ